MALVEGGGGYGMYGSGVPNSRNIVARTKWKSDWKKKNKKMIRAAVKKKQPKSRLGNTSTQSPMTATERRLREQMALLKKNTEDYGTPWGNTAKAPATDPWAGTGSDYGAAGVGGTGGGTTGAASGAPKLPALDTGDTYNNIINAMQGLYERYGNLRSEYRPNYFDYEEFNPDEDAYQQRATTRMQSELAARNPIWNEQEAANIRAYEAALQMANEEQRLARADIGRAADAEAGRLSNMMANTGMGAGQGAIQEKFGVDQAFANQNAAVASQYGMQRAQAALDKANALGGIEAERAGFKGGMTGQIEDLANQYAEAEYNKWFNERGFQYQNFSDFEQRRYQTYMDAYQSALNALNSQAGILGQQAGLMQDQRNYLSSQQLALYDRAYQAYIDGRNYDYQKYMDAIAKLQWQDTFGLQKTQAGWEKEYNDQYLDLINSGKYTG